MSLSSFLQASVPVFIPSFNNPTYCAQMIDQLQRLGLQKIVLLDGGSSLEEMVNLIKDPGENVSSVVLEGNPGPRHLLLDSASFSLLPRHFCLTDPDLKFSSEMPNDFIARLAAVAERESSGKVGLALDISDREYMTKEKFLIESKNYHVWEWEEQFWQQPLEPTIDGDPLYEAAVDTTFALYDKAYYDFHQPLKAIRVAGRFTCKHLPWYIEERYSTAERDYYKKRARFSFYLGENRDHD